jgi:hypothetical protein
MSIPRNRPRKFWIVVASKDHVERGQALGIVQANHGKAAPMKRMRAGDFIVFYSPKLRFQVREERELGLCLSFRVLRDSEKRLRNHLQEDPAKKNSLDRVPPESDGSGGNGPQTGRSPSGLPAHHRG